MFRRMTCFSLAALAILPATAAAEAREVCGPAGVKTLAKSAEARVWVSQGTVRACHRAHSRIYRLGPRATIIDAKVAGRYTSVRGRATKAQTLRVYDLRTGRATSKQLRYARFRMTKLDSTGTAAFVAVGADGLNVVGVSSGWQQGRLPRVDDLGLRGRILAYRTGTRIVPAQIGDALRRPATDGTLLQVGGVRLDVTRGKLRMRNGAGRWINVEGQAAAWRCASQSGCAGWGTIQVVGSRVVVPNTTPGGNGTLVTVYDLVSGTSTKPCNGDAKSIVVTDMARVACGQWGPGGERQIVFENVVLDSGPDIYLYSLARRGDLLVWLNGNVEKSAPLVQ